MVPDHDPILLPAQKSLGSSFRKGQQVTDHNATLQTSELRLSAPSIKQSDIDAPIEITRPEVQSVGFVEQI